MRSGLDHQVDGITVFDRVFFEELGVGEGFTFKQEPLDVCRRCGWFSCELGFDRRDCVRWLNGKRERRGGLERFEGDRDRGCFSISLGVKRRVETGVYLKKTPRGVLFVGVEEGLGSKWVRLYRKSSKGSVSDLPHVPIVLKTRNILKEDQKLTGSTGTLFKEYSGGC